MELNTGMALGVEYFQDSGIGKCEGKETFFFSFFFLETYGSTTGSALHSVAGFAFYYISSFLPF